jgi:hypothetical protein
VLQNCDCDYWPTGRPDEHHVIPQATIKGQYSYWNGLTPSRRKNKRLVAALPPLDEALEDFRNIVPICRYHHGEVTNARLYVPASAWPDGIRDFAEETGLTWWLEKWSEPAAPKPITPNTMPWWAEGSNYSPNE